MNKRLIASVSCAAILLSSMGLAVHANSIKMANVVDVVTTASTSTPTPSTPSSPSTPSKPIPVMENATEITRLLALNSVGGDVSLLQTLLNSNGYVLKVDGIYGPKTLAAVESYQGKVGLKADGIVGPKTLAKLAPVVAEVVEPVEPEEVVEEVEEVVDAVTSASIVSEAAAFEKALSTEENGGTWIICTLNDLTFENELVLEGTLTNGKKDAEGNDIIQRKIAPYTQEKVDGKNVVVDRFTITAPKLTINSPNARIQAGTFIGDIYVNVPNFQLVDANVEGNIYFLNNDAKNTFKMDESSSLKGQRVLIVEEIDALSTASIVKDEATFEKAIVTAEEGGTWIAALLKDLTFNKTLTLEGPFENRNVADRKIGLYSQKTLEDKTKVTTHNFTLTAPKLFIKSPSARMLSGTFNGNLYIFEDNFKLENTIVNGSVYFTTESAKNTFNPDDKSVITGEQELIEVDAITSASVVSDEVNLEKAISKHGVWITLLRDDITTDKELVMEGEFRNGKFTTKGTHAFDRKLALYNYAEGSREVGARYTLKTPKLTVKVPNARIQEGTIVGDLYISAPGVRLINTIVEGNVYFATQEAKDTFMPEGTFSISGVQELITE